MILSGVFTQDYIKCICILFECIVCICFPRCILPYIAINLSYYHLYTVIYVTYRKKNSEIPYYLKMVLERLIIFLHTLLVKSVIRVMMIVIRGQ